MAAEVVLITGGAGFLAQHLIRELQKNYSGTVKLIKLIDRNKFEKTISYPDNIPLESVKCDLSELDSLGLDNFFKDATVIYHLCSSSYGLDMFDDPKIHQRDSYKTTENVFELARRHSIGFVINAADAMQHLGMWDHAMMPNELKSLKAPPSYMLGHYAEWKFKSEQLVRQMDCTQLSNGGQLRTASVRSTPLYGEGNNWVVSHALKFAHANGGLLPLLGDGVNVLQFTYAGNVANLMTVVYDNLKNRPDEFDSEVFFSNDRNCHFHNVFNYLKPIVEGAGMRVASKGIGYEAASIGAWVVSKITHAVYSMTGYKLDHGIPPVQMTRILSGLNFHFSSTKARIMLNWIGPYDPDEAMMITLKWWKDNYYCVLPTKKSHI